MGALSVSSSSAGSAGGSMPRERNHAVEYNVSS
jgi:hypothetical protein